MLDSLAAIALSTAVFCLLASFTNRRGLSQDDPDVDIKPLPSRISLLAAAWCSGIASLFSLVAALWQHIAASSAAVILDVTTQQRLSASPGTLAMALGWLVFALITVVVLWLISTVSSIHVLDRFIDD